MGNGFNPGQNLSFGNYGSNYGAGYGGGGTAPGWGSAAAGEMAAANPIGMAAQAAQGILGGLISGFFAQAQQKKKAKAFKAEQNAYQSKASQLFPELAKESFMYNNPALKNAYQGALAYRLKNMFSDWGMPTDRRQNAGSINDFFASMMQPQQPQMPPMPMSGQPLRGKGIDMYGGGGYGGGGSPMVNMGGWMDQSQAMPRYAQGGIIDRPQIAMLGERGPEAVVPLGRYPRRRQMNQGMGMYPGGSNMERMGLPNPELYPQGGGTMRPFQMQGPMPNSYSIQPMSPFAPMQGGMGSWGNQPQPPRSMPQRGANGGWMNNMQNRQMIY